MLPHKASADTASSKHRALEQVIQSLCSSGPRNEAVKPGGNKAPPPPVILRAGKQWEQPYPPKLGVGVGRAAATASHVHPVHLTQSPQAGPGSGRHPDTTDMLV